MVRMKLSEILNLHIETLPDELPEELSSQEFTYEFNYPEEDEEEVFHEVEPDTGIHGVKLVRGHLHLNNQTYEYYDPSRPHSTNIHENRETATDYVLAGTFIFACVLLIILILWLIFKGFRWALGYQGYSQFDNDRGDSVTR
jgi:hypothetical protein